MRELIVNRLTLKVLISSGRKKMTLEGNLNTQSVNVPDTVKKKENTPFFSL